MTTIAFDTRKAVRNLQAAGFAEVQADAFTDTVATKTDIAEVKTELKSMATKAEIAEVKAEIGRLEGRVFRALWIQGAGIVGIQLAIAGLLFAAIRFLGQPV